MIEAILDSNIVIDPINGVPAAAEEWKRYAEPAISVVTWIEVVAGTGGADKAVVRRFLDGIIPDRADARHCLLLVTRNERDFPEGMPGICIPYRR